LYWAQQFTVAGTLLIATTAAGLGGAFIYGLARPKSTVPGGTVTTAA
jgi:hypothetical protein